MHFKQKSQSSRAEWFFCGKLIALEGAALDDNMFYMDGQCTIVQIMHTFFEVTLSNQVNTVSEVRVDS